MTVNSNGAMSPDVQSPTGSRRRSSRCSHRASRLASCAREGKGSSLYDADDGGDKYDEEDDIIPATDGPRMVTTGQDIAADLLVAEKAAELIEKHCQEFMKRAFSVRTHAADVPLTTASTSIQS